MEQPLTLTKFSKKKEEEKPVGQFGLRLTECYFVCTLFFQVPHGCKNLGHYYNNDTKFTFSLVFVTSEYLNKDAW